MTTEQSEVEAISRACVLQDRLDLPIGLKIELLNGNPDAIIATFNRVMDEMDAIRKDLDAIIPATAKLIRLSECPTASR